MKNKPTLTLKELDKLYKEAEKITKCPKCDKEMEIVWMYVCKKHGIPLEK